VILPGQRLPIVIALRPVDFRRGHDGLAATVQNELGLDPHSGLTVVFRSKRGDRVKVLVWDGTGLVMIYKRLDQGRFAWPAGQDGVMRLSRAQYEALFEGFDWRRVMARRVLAPAAAS
jgi:transposase